LDSPTTAYQKQVCALAHLCQNECPKQVLLEDLTNEIRGWQAEGGSIILLTDVNNDVCDWEIMSSFQDLGLEEALMAVNGNDAPPTHQCRCRPIDGIFMLRYLC